MSNVIKKRNPSQNFSHGFFETEKLWNFTQAASGPPQYFMCSIQSPTSVQLLQWTEIPVTSHESRNAQLGFRKHPHELWHWCVPVKVSTFSYYSYKRWKWQQFEKIRWELTAVGLLWSFVYLKFLLQSHLPLLFKTEILIYLIWEDN